MTGWAGGLTETDGAPLPPLLSGVSSPAAAATLPRAAVRSGEQHQLFSFLALAEAHCFLSSCHSGARASMSRAIHPLYHPLMASLWGTWAVVSLVLTSLKTSQSPGRSFHGVCPVSNGRGEEVTRGGDVQGWWPRSKPSGRSPGDVTRRE